MKKFIVLCMTICSLQVFAQSGEVMSAENVEKRTVGSFTGLKVSDGIDVYLTQGDEESVAVSASEPKFLERLKTEVEGGTLKIYYDSKGMVWNGNGKRKLTAYVSFKTLEKLKASSGSSVKMKSVFTGATVEFDLSSGAHFEGTVKIDNLDVSQNSGAETEITGTVGALKTDASSGAIFRGYDLTTDMCEAKASSGGEVRVTINKELIAKASSGGAVRYKGSAVIKDINVSSGGTVKKGS